MDVSSVGGALIVTILRLLHIVGGLVWVGAAIVMSFYIEPAIDRADADGTRIWRRLYNETSFPRLIPLSALATTVAGLLLYAMLSYHEAMSSAMGIILTLGALFGLLAFAHGYFAVWRRTGAYRRLLAEADADERALDGIADRLRRNGRVSMWLALVSLILMAGARYVSPIFA